MGTLKELTAACKKLGGSAPDCVQAKSLGATLTDGIFKTIGMLDHDCPFVVEPKFSKWMAGYSDAALKLKLQK